MRKPPCCPIKWIVAALARLAILLLPGIDNISIAQENAHGGDPFFAFSWAPSASELEYVVPFFWLRGETLTNPVSGTELAIKRLNGILPGKRAIATVDLLSNLHRHHQDFLRDKRGNPAICIDEAGEVRKFPAVWWDRGADAVRRNTTEWFRHFADQGGKVDFLILDYEVDSSYRHLYHRLPNPGGICGIAAYLDALKKDPRFAAVETDLYGRNISEMLQWDRNDTVLVWRNVAMELAARYIEQAVFEPVRKFYPRIKFSNYGFYAQAPEYSQPSRFGQFLHRYGTGRQVGTHQSPALYGWVGKEGAVSLSDGTSLAATPFNAMRIDLNILRGMRLSSSAPLLPWIAYKGFSESLLRDNDLYQEQLYHILLGAVDGLLYWNPRETEPPATEEEDRLLSRVIGEVGSLCDYRRPQPLDSELAPWSATYLLTGARAGRRKIWRFTPDPDLGQKPTDYIVGDSPLTLKVDGKLLHFPLAEILQPVPQLSSAGLWIVLQDAAWTGL